jgi:hypothetical protein
MKSSLLRKWIVVLGAAAGLCVLFFWIERPWFMRWGATDAEVRATLAGDERVPRAMEQSTRAVTVQAPIDRVWPWLAQLGQDRGGFYSYEILEDLVGCEMPRATRILPEHQDWKPGDALWMYPPDKLNGIAHAPLVAFERGRHLVFVTRPIGARPGQTIQATWGFYLEPVGGSQTRLIVRSRGVQSTDVLGAFLDRGLFEPMHYVMERKMMVEIRALAEGRPTSRLADSAQVSLWTLAFGWTLVAMVQVARRGNWGRALGASIAAAVAFQMLTFLQPAPLLGATLIAVLALAAWWKPKDRGRWTGAERRAPDTRRGVLPGIPATNAMR